MLVGLAANVEVAASSPQSWNIVTAPDTNPTTDNLLVGGTCVDAFDCLAVGLTSTNFNNGTFHPLLETWNGTSWTIASSPKAAAGSQYALINTTCLSDADCWAVGATLSGPHNNPSAGLTEHWNGSSWSVVPSPAPPGPGGALIVAVTCATSSDCWAAGTLMTNGNQSGALLEHWNGSKWALSTFAPSGQAYQEFNAVTCDGPSDCWAVGTAGPNPQNSDFLPIFPGAVGDQGLVEHWNGEAWSLTTNPVAASPEGRYLAGVTCVTKTNCWISGTTTNSSGRSAGSLTERWNGSSWVVVSSPTPPDASGAILSSVSCLGATECWASGSINQGATTNFQPEALIESWNGTTWTVQSSPNVTALSFLRGIACVHGTGCWAMGSSVTDVNGNSPLFQTLIEQLKFPASSVQGLWIVSSRGTVYAFGQARRFAPRSSRTVESPVVAIAATPDRKGYWLVHADGAVYEFSDAVFHGSPKSLRRPIAGMAPTPSGLGYWLVASNGRAFAFGDATPHGSLGPKGTGRTIVGISATPDGGGYWLVSSSGDVFPLGDAKSYPSRGVEPIERPVAGMATTPDGRGYWLVTPGGNVRAFGDATYYGSPTGQGITSPVPITSVVATPDGRGYWVVGANGSVYQYGDAAFLNSLGGRRPPAPIAAAASL